MALLLHITWLRCLSIPSHIGENGVSLWAALDLEGFTFISLHWHRLSLQPRTPCLSHPHPISPVSYWAQPVTKLYPFFFPPGFLPHKNVFCFKRLKVRLTVSQRVLTPGQRFSCPLCWESVCNTSLFALLSRLYPSVIIIPIMTAGRPSPQTTFVWLHDDLNRLSTAAGERQVPSHSTPLLLLFSFMTSRSQ